MISSSEQSRSMSTVANIDIPAVTQKTPATNGNGVTLAFILELDRIQEQQIVFTNKLEKEKRRREYLDENLEVAAHQLREAQGKTQNGFVVREHDVIHQKHISRLEHQVDAGKVKVSVQRKNNQNLKQKVMDFRKEKRVQLQILDNLNKSLSAAKDKIDSSKREAISVNERKLRIQLGVASLKSKMIREIEDFSSEVIAARSDISAAQGIMLGHIRQKLQVAQSLASTSSSSRQRGFNRTNGTDDGGFSKARNSTSSRNQGPGSGAGSADSFDLSPILEECGMSSLEDLVATLQKSEEAMFVMYTELQEKNLEAEEQDFENRKLQEELLCRELELTRLEEGNGQLFQEIEDQIQDINTQLAQSNAEADKASESLHTISESAMNLLRNVALEEEALDLQLLSTGINERNISQFLGLIEDRIDGLIQMSKASMHHNLRREDFVLRSPTEERNSLKTGSNIKVPTLPSLEGGDMDWDEDDNQHVRPVDLKALKEQMHRRALRTLSKKKSTMSNASLNSSASRQSFARGNSRVNVGLKTQKGKN